MNQTASFQSNSASHPPTGQERADRWLRPLATTTLLLLAAQFLIGMLVNLFVVLPTAHPGAQAPEYFSGVVEGVWWARGGQLGDRRA